MSEIKIKRLILAIKTFFGDQYHSPYELLPFMVVERSEIIELLEKKGANDE